MTATGLVRTRSIFLLIALVVLMPTFALSQEPQGKQDNSFLVQLKYTKLDFPALSSTTCMAVFPDGRFHLEHSSMASTLDVSKFQTFEDVLSEKNLKSLLAILSADDFKSLKALPIAQGPTVISEGQLIWAFIPRARETQTFFLLGLEGSSHQYPRPLPHGVVPLVEWIHTITKELAKQRVSPLKGIKPVNCWLPRSLPKPAETTPSTPRPEAKTVDVDQKEIQANTVQDKPQTADEHEPRSGASDVNSYEHLTTFVNFTVSELLRRIPELRGLKPATNQQELPTLLAKLGDKTQGLFHKMPNLISREEVIQTRRGSKPIRQQFEYLILPHQTREAVMLDEYRVDVGNKTLIPAADNPAASTASGSRSVWDELRRKSAEASVRDGGAPPLSQGFANKWVHFYPSNRSESEFRHLGQQHIDGHNTFVIAFAQKPGSVRTPGELRFQGRSLPLYYQGIAWVDESDFRIVRLRTDLLAPLRDAHLQKLTAEIHFGDAQIVQTASPLWLPRDVMVTSEVNGQVFQEQHRYSDYRAYAVESKIVPIPP